MNPHSAQEDTPPQEHDYPFETEVAEPIDAQMYLALQTALSDFYCYKWRSPEWFQKNPSKAHRMVLAEAFLKQHAPQVIRSRISW